MIKAKLKLSLLSDAVPGNGEGLAGIIDTDICYDEYGSLCSCQKDQGILRESARDLMVIKWQQLSRSTTCRTIRTKMGTDLKIDNDF